MLILDCESICSETKTCSTCWADNDGGLWCWGGCGKAEEKKQATSDKTSIEPIEEVFEECIEEIEPTRKCVKVSEYDECWAALYIAIMCGVSQEQAYLKLEKHR